MQEQIDQLERKVQELTSKIEMLNNSTTISYDTEQALRERLRINDLTALLNLTGLFTAPLSSITEPSGGLTIDSEARTAINTIITRLESLDLVNDN
jgi:hypothetical protein